MATLTYNMEGPRAFNDHKMRHYDHCMPMDYWRDFSKSPGKKFHEISKKFMMQKKRCDPNSSYCTNFDEENLIPLIDAAQILAKRVG